MLDESTNLQLQAMLEAHGVGSSAPPKRDATVEPTESPKYGRRNSQRVRNHNSEGSPHGEAISQAINTVAPPHPACAERSKKLAYNTRTTSISPWEGEKMGTVHK